jgi:hypothetical protein
MKYHTPLEFVNLDADLHREGFNIVRASYDEATREVELKICL